eukprot:g21096.t1
MVKLNKAAMWMFQSPTSSTSSAPGTRRREEREERGTSLYKEGDIPSAPQKKKKTSNRTWSDPQGAEECWARFKVTSAGRCCRLRCIERFASNGGRGFENEGGGGGGGALAAALSSPPPATAAATGGEEVPAPGRAAPEAAAAAGAGGEGGGGWRRNLQYNGDLLRAEQAAFTRLTTEVDRKSFVIGCRPVLPLARGQGSMMAAGTPVCNKAFIPLFGVSVSLINAVKNTPKARASSSATRSLVVKSQIHRKKDEVLGFLHHYEENFAQHMPNSEDKRLYFRYKNELYDEYEAEIRSRFGQDTTGLDDALCSRDYFYKVWAAHHPHLKLKQHGDFMLCQICTLLKEALYGQKAGSRGAYDQAELALHRSQYESHVQVSEQDRDTD